MSDDNAPDQEFTAHIASEQISKLKAECVDDTPSGEASLSPLVTSVGRVSESLTMVCELGIGSTSTVYLAIDHRATGRERYVAVKRFRPELTERELFTDLFIEELQNAVSVTHPNVCRVSDFGRAGPSYYMAMEFLNGESLEKLQLAPGFRLLQARRPRMIAALFARFAEGLHAGHSMHDDLGGASALHRDVTPRNLFVLYDGSVRVTDFGTAWTRDMGKDRPDLDASADLSCWAPEQLDRGGLDARVDVWGLGVVLWESLTGQKLFRCQSEREAAVEITARRVPPPSDSNPQVPPELDRIVLKALTRNRDKRYASALELAAELESYVTNSGARLDQTEISAWIAQLMPTGGERGSSLIELAEAVDARETGSDVAAPDYLPAAQDEPEHTTHIFTGHSINTLRATDRLPFGIAPIETVSFKDSPATARNPRRVSPLRKPMGRTPKRAWPASAAAFAAPIVLALLGIGVWQLLRTNHPAAVSSQPTAAPAAQLESTQHAAAPATRLVATQRRPDPAPAPSTAQLSRGLAARDERPTKPPEKPARAPAPSSHPVTSTKIPSATATKSTEAPTATAQIPGAVFVTTPGEVYDHGRLLGRAPRAFELSPGAHALSIKTATDTRTATVNVPAGAQIVVSMPPPAAPSPESSY